ncbi:MAG: response regulator transcription factor [Bryobacteraceae bacterium]
MSTQNPQRVLVVDDEGPIRGMLTHIIEGSGGNVVGEAKNGEEAIEASKRLRPDLICLDISMPTMGGFPAARWLKRNMPELAIIFVTQHREQSYREEAMNCGARGYVIKSAALTELPDAMHTLEAGGTFCSSLVA